MKQNPHQNDASGLLNAELLIGAEEKFLTSYGKQTAASSQVGVDSTLTASCSSQLV